MSAIREKYEAPRVLLQRHDGTANRPDRHTANMSSLPRSAPAGRIDQPLDRLDVVDVGRALRRLACRGPERLAGALGGLRLGVELDRAGAGPLGVDPRSDLRELAAQLGLDLLGALELAAGAVHAAELAGEQRDLARDDQPADRAVGLARRRA